MEKAQSNQTKRLPTQSRLSPRTIKKNTDEYKPDQAEEIRQMLDKEIRRATYKKLSRLTKGPHDSGLSKVLCPNDDNDTITD
jgi:hydrogenase maturation factor HypE